MNQVGIKSWNIWLESCDAMSDETACVQKDKQLQQGIFETLE